MFSSEALVVETPDTPECVPAVIDHITLSRTGLSRNKIRYDLHGRLSFASTMWEKNSFTRERVTENFNLSVSYLYSKEEEESTTTMTTTTGEPNSQKRSEVYRDWKTDALMKIDSLNATITRKQFIFLQTILDNQLADIRDVSAKVTLCLFVFSLYFFPPFFLKKDAINA